MTAPALMTESVLSEDERDTCFGLASQLVSQSAGLQLKNAYYNGAQIIHSLNISIPPQLRGLHTVVGWPRINCDSLEERLDFQGWRLANDQATQQYLADIYAYNSLHAESQLAHLDAIIYGHAFVVIGKNDDPNLPPLLSVESPLEMTCDFDARTREVRSALRLYEVDNERFGTLYLPDETIEIALSSTDGYEVIGRDEHNQGVVPVVRLSNRQRVTDRAGSSEINNEVISITDSACRTLGSVEVAREFYSAPQRYILGAPESAFMDAEGNPRNAWETYLGRILAIERDETDQLPTVGQFDPFSPGVFTDIIEMYGKLMVAQTGLPPQYLGLTFENPPSADAIRMGEQRLVKRAERRIGGFTVGWQDVGRKSVLWGKGTVPDPTMALEALYRDAATPTLAAQVDATVKLVTAGIVPADSDVTLEMAGFTPDQRERIATDKRRADAQAARQALLVASAGGQAGAPAPNAQAANKGVPGADPTTHGGS